MQENPAATAGASRDAAQAFARRVPTAVKRPRRETAYLNYVATTWKANHEAFKREGLILSYKVLTTEGHSPSDYNVILMTEYKDLATMEANELKADALAQKIEGDDAKQMQGYKERADIREIVGDRLAREMVLEPRP